MSNLIDSTFVFREQRSSNTLYQELSFQDTEAMGEIEDGVDITGMNSLKTTLNYWLIAPGLHTFVFAQFTVNFISCPNGLVKFIFFRGETCEILILDYPTQVFYCKCICSVNLF